MTCQFLLSIIIPYHDRFDFLDHLIHTIPDLDCIEVILIDDSSFCKFTPRRTFSFATLTLKKLPSYHGRYAGNARNFGFSISTGKYVTFVDSDDVLDPVELSKILTYIDCIDYDVYYSRLTSFDNDNLQLLKGANARSFKYNLILQEYWITREVNILRRFVVPHGKIIKAEFLRRHSLLFEPVRYSNDVLFSCNLLSYGPHVRVLDDCFYKVRQGGMSLTSSRELDSTMIRLSVLSRYNNALAMANCSHLQIPAISFLRRLPFVDCLKSTVDLMMRGQPILFSKFSLYLFIKSFMYRLFVRV